MNAANPRRPSPPARREPVTEHEQVLLASLRKIADVTERNAHEPTDPMVRAARQTFRWMGMEPFVLMHGRFFDAPTSARPDDVPRMTDKKCFTNAADLATRKGWRYAEGFALDDLRAHDLPLHHAWCVTHEGRVVEPTWPGPGAAYFGFQITPRALWNHIARTQRPGLLHDWFRPGALELVLEAMRNDEHHLETGEP